MNSPHTAWWTPRTPSKPGNSSPTPGQQATWTTWACCIDRRIASIREAASDAASRVEHARYIAERKGGSLPNVHLLLHNEVPTEQVAALYESAVCGIPGASGSGASA